MAIKDLQPKQGNVDIEVEVVEVGEPREFQKFGKAGKVATATVKDDSGTIKMSLWNEQVDQISAGDKLKITNGYVNEYQGDMQLTTGRFGQLEIVGKEASADKPAEPAAPAEEDAPEEEPSVDEEKVE
jgi:replication factor A1